MILLRQAKQIKATEAVQVAAVFGDLLALEDEIARDQEHFYVMHLDARNYVMHLDARNTVKLVELVTVRLSNSAPVHPRKTFRRAVIEGSVSIIVAHNHPSGEVDPSEDDIRTTRVLHEAGEILGIPLVDHLIFAGNTFYSFCTQQKAAIDQK